MRIAQLLLSIIMMLWALTIFLLTQEYPISLVCFSIVCTTLALMAWIKAEKQEEGKDV